VRAFPLLTEGYIHPRFLFNSGAVRLQLTVSILHPLRNELTIALRVSKARFALDLGGGDLEGGIEGEVSPDLSRFFSLPSLSLSHPLHLAGRQKSLINGSVSSCTASRGKKLNVLMRRVLWY
jgi:hypothetical protein